MTPSSIHAADIPPLACDSIVQKFDDQTVLNGVGLCVEPDMVMGLVGRNGAGKTTLIHVLMGLLQPAQGQAHVWGTPALALTDDIKSRIGYVPQQPEALNWLKVGDMLNFVGQHYARWDQQFVNKTLAQWQIPAGKVLSKLSPGERQRVALVRALASRPDLLVLDEPAAALDPVARRDLLREIAMRAEERGTTVLFSTHIVTDLERVASHITFLHNGKVLLSSALDELKERHARLHIPCTTAPLFPTALKGEVARRPTPDGGLVLTLIREPGQPWPDITHVTGVRMEHLPLEDLFIEVAQ